MRLDPLALTAIVVIGPIMAILFSILAGGQAEAGHRQKRGAVSSSLGRAGSGPAPIAAIRRWLSASLPWRLR